MAKQGGNDNGHAQTEWVYFLVVALTAACCWAIWTYARSYVVLPAFASNLLMVEIYDLLFGLSPGGLGQKMRDYIYATFDGRVAPSTGVSWGEFVTVRSTIGSIARWVISPAILVMAVVIVFKMKGDGFKRVFSLAGGKNRGPSLAIEAARQWKTATAGAMFDPDGRDKDILPARTPFEWLKLHNISFEDGELDREAAAAAFAEQLGKPWHGVARADLPVQTFLILAGMHLTRNKAAMSSREEVSIAWAAGGNGTEKMKEIVAEGLKNEKLVSTIDKVCSKHAFAHTAVIALLDLARRKGGVFPAADFVWIRKVDRNLWYAVNNVGRRRFHTEGAGAISHFFAERVVGSQLPDPQVDEAVNGIEDYLAEHGIESLSQFFNRKQDEF